MPLNPPEANVLARYLTLSATLVPDGSTEMSETIIDAILDFRSWSVNCERSNSFVLPFNQYEANHEQEQMRFNSRGFDTEQSSDINLSSCDEGDAQISTISESANPKSTIENSNLQELQSEIASLKRELLELKQEKADLEILLEATAEHSDSVEAELHNTAIAALKQSEEMFRTIAEATPVPVLISRLEDGIVLYANSAASTAFGILPEEFLTHKTVEFYHDPRDRQKLLDAIECNGCVQNFELQYKRADGSLFWVAASLQRLTFNNEPVLLTALCDITQRKQEEEALKRQVKELQIEIDHARRAKQVAEIVQSDYFQQLQSEVERLRYPEDEF